MPDTIGVVGALPDVGADVVDHLHVDKLAAGWGHAVVAVARKI